MPVTIIKESAKESLALAPTGPQRPRQQRPMGASPTLSTRSRRALAGNAIERDRRGGTAKHERDLIRRSGLLALSIPADEGGWGASWAATLQAVRRLARVDGSLAHLFGFHHLLLATIRLFGERRPVARGLRRHRGERWFWGNALNPLDTRTTIVPEGERLRRRGDKSFCSGARDSDRLIISALDLERRLVVAAIPTARDGIEIHDDWDNMGQRQTDSGSVSFRRVRVADRRDPADAGAARQRLGLAAAVPRAAILANVFLGLGEGALAEARAFTRESGRAWPASGVATPAEDPYVLQRYGELWVGARGRARAGRRSGGRVRPRLGARRRAHTRRARRLRPGDRRRQGGDVARGAGRGVAHVRGHGRARHGRAERARSLLAQSADAHAARSRRLQAARARPVGAGRASSHAQLLFMRSTP